MTQTQLTLTLRTLTLTLEAPAVVTLTLLILTLTLVTLTLVILTPVNLPGHQNHSTSDPGDLDPRFCDHQIVLSKCVNALSSLNPKTTNKETPKSFNSNIMNHSEG